jgi:hypothetical protein
MGGIYKSASHVIVWLGPEDTRSKAEIYAVCRLAEDLELRVKDDATTGYDQNGMSPEHSCAL